MFDHETEAFNWVNRLGFLVRKEIAVRFRAAGHDISPEEWAILLALWKHGVLTPSAIAERTIKDRTTVTRLIDGMVRKGLAEREADAADRRRVFVRASARGTALKETLVPLAQALIAEATLGVPDKDLAITTRTLRHMTETLLKATDSGSKHKGSV